MKITIAQLNFLIGDFTGNVDKMLDAVATAKKDGADIICFSELATCGYPPRDFLEFDDFIRQAEKAIKRLAKAAKKIAIVVGSPARNPVVEGKDLFNAAYFLADGKIKQVAHKALLPTYDIFDEYRYFEPGNDFKIVKYKGKRIALTVCEDIWNIGNKNPLYTVCPMDEMMPQKPDFILNVSASPFSFSQAKSRIKVVRANIKRYGIPMFYVNHVGAQTELIFDGGSIVMSANGKLHDELPYFEEAVRTYDDMCGGLSVIGDVYKTEVFELARYMNKDGEVIPENTITKPPSAELRPNQKDSDSLPDYDILDEILFQYIEKRKGPKEIIRMGFDKELVRRILRLVNINEFKRYQTAPVLRVSSKAFGMGRRMPIVGKYLN